jgi:glycosyltransferase involved in cell wall biosynthesis/beta-glucosidase/6-phospho-beta-glucosidase/beta-galactosidase
VPSRTSPYPRTSGRSPAIPFIAGFESTYLPLHDVDIAETTSHDRRWRQDLAGLEGHVRHARYPLRWHRIEAERGRYDWRSTDTVLAHLQEMGVSPIVDLVHHTSYPGWLDDGLRDRRFGPAFVDFASAVAERYPWLEAYTLLNEPFSTLHFAGHEGLWPPYDSGLAGMARLVANVLPALSEAASIWRELLPEAEHVWVDTCEHHACVPGTAESHVEMANDRRHVILDLALGHRLDLDRPYLGPLVRAGAEAALDMPPLQVDVLGLDYYAFHEWWYDASGGRAPSPHPLGFATVARQYWERYGIDLMLSETNLRGLPSDRVSWLRYVMEQYELAVAQGVPLRGLCWYPHVDSADWDSLLARPAGRTDPVGVVAAAGGNREATIFTAAWNAAAAGAGSGELPPYRFQSPAAEQLAGFLPQMAHWDWVDPPANLAPAPIVISDPEVVSESDPEEVSVHTKNNLSGEPLRRDPLAADVPVPISPDLMVVSHLRWTWVWQRPQHLVSRFARVRAAEGALTWYVEEPTWGVVAEPTLRTERHDGVIRVWLELPRDPRQPEVIGFDASGAERYPAMVADLLAERGRPAHPDVLLYTPMAFHFAEAMKPARLAYDVMDDLSSFKNAPQGLRLRQRRLLADADVVFTGGRSLHRSTLTHRSADCHLFPSGVETAHYAVAKNLRKSRRVKVAGYVGVIDERLDLDLIEGLAAALPDWKVRIVGPVAKIDPDSLPQAPNLAYPGQVAYPELPGVMAGFDVALMPFALNEATRSISPTKTLEYLAAGLPVVSTRVPDVVTDYSGIVHLADDATEFAESCREALAEPATERDHRIRKITQRHEWDYIATQMYGLIRPEPASSSVTYTEEASA